jgi:preprotein translocase subunit SecD
MAVQEGFKHAWVTIVDTHVTTIVSAAILFLFGTGPVKGFAVTLTIGLLANIFTAVLVSRVIFDAELRNKDRNAALSI